MAFPGELIRKVSWKVTRPNSTDALYRRPELRIRKQGYLITCVQESLPAGLKAIELGPTKKGVELIVWDPTLLQVADEQFRREADDKNGKEAHRHAQHRMDSLNYYAPGKYKLIIRDYPTKTVMIKILHKPTPEGPANPQGDETTVYVATASPADRTSQ
jgi:hypothetical protein